MNTTETMPMYLVPTGGEHSRPPHLLVGRNSRGQWVVRDRHASCGGLFNSRADALSFAFRERGESPGAVVLVPSVLELFEAPANDAATGSGSSKEVRATARPNPLEV